MISTSSRAACPVGRRCFEIFLKSQIAQESADQRPLTLFHSTGSLQFEIRERRSHLSVAALLT